MFIIDSTSSEPPFEQLKRQVLAQRASGELPADHRLPPVRTLASQLGLAPNTVAKAYRELEHAGAIETRGRHGSFVTSTTASAEKVAAVSAKEFAALVHRLGISHARALALLTDALAELE